MDYTLKQIKGSFNTSVDDFSMIFRRFFRPASFYITFILLKLGIRKPNTATMLGLLSGVISMVFFIVGQKTFFYLGIFFYVFFLILDFVDGNIARVTDSATYYGKFLDGVIDAFVESCLPFSVAIGLYVLSGNPLYLFSGSGVAMASLFAFFMVNRAFSYKRWIEMDKRNSHMGLSNLKDLQRLNPLRIRRFSLKEIDNISVDIKIIILLTTAFIGMTKILFILFLVSIAARAMALIVITSLDATGQFNVHRISRLDSRLIEKRDSAIEE